MSSREIAANTLWAAGRDSGQEPNSKGWWLALADAALMLSAKSLVEEELGGQEVSDRKLAEEPDTTTRYPKDFDKQQNPSAEDDAASIESTEADRLASLPEDVGPRQAAERVGMSRGAQTNVSTPLTREFRPSKYGYTLKHLSRDYPHVDTSTILEAFLSHYIAKGQTSKNWLEMFFAFAATNERFVKERQAGKVETDSMGQPLDAGVRVARVRETRAHSMENNQFIDEQIAAEAAQRESNQ